MILLLLFSGCWISGTRLEAQDKLVLVSPHWEGIKFEFERAFRKYYRSKTKKSVELDWRDVGGTSDILRFLTSEYKHSPDGIGIDLFFGGGMDPYIDLASKGLLWKYEPPKGILTRIPPSLNGVPIYDSKGYWYGVALSGFGILKNNRVVQTMGLPSVETWKDLADPRLKGWVGSGDPRNSGSVHLVYECILQAYGWEEGWKVIQGMGSNVRQFERSAGSSAKSCSLGNVAYTLVVDLYGLMQIAEVGEENMSLIIPAKESVVTPDPIAILKGAPHRNAAKLFVDFVLSEAGQNLWLAPMGYKDIGARKFRIERMSVIPDLYEKLHGVTPIQTNPFTDLAPLTYRSDLGSKRWSALNALLGAMVIDRPADQRNKISIPVTEQELLDLSAKEWNDPVQRARIQLEWQSLR